MDHPQPPASDPSTGKSTENTTTNPSMTTPESMEIQDQVRIEDLSLDKKLE